MMSIETRINGRLISYTHVYNEFQVDGQKSMYYVEHHRINLEPKVMSFRISHNRSEGGDKLALLIYREIDKRVKKLNGKKAEN